MGNVIFESHCTNLAEELFFSDSTNKVLLAFKVDCKDLNLLGLVSVPFTLNALIKQNSVVFWTLGAAGGS